MDFWLQREKDRLAKLYPKLYLLPSDITNALGQQSEGDESGNAEFEGGKGKGIHENNKGGGKTILAIRNEPGGILEVPDMDEGLGWGRRFQIFVACDNGGGGNSRTKDAGGVERKEVEVFLIRGNVEDVKDGGRGEGGNTATKGKGINPREVSNSSSIHNTPTLNPVEAPVIPTGGRKAIKLVPIERTDGCDFNYHIEEGEGISDFF